MKKNIVIFLVSISLVILGIITDDFFGFLPQLDDYNLSFSTLLIYLFSLPFCIILINNIYSIFLYITKHKRPIRYSVIFYILGFIITQLFLSIIDYWSFPNHFTIIEGQKSGTIIGIFAWFLNYLLSIILGIFGWIIDRIICLIQNKLKNKNHPS